MTTDKTESEQNSMPEVLNQIQKRMTEGYSVVVATYTRATQYKPKHVGMFRVTGNTLEVQRGRNWDALSCAGRLSVGIRFVR